MSNWRPDFQPDHLYFVTTTATSHALLFQRDIIKRLVVDSLDCLRIQKRLKLFCYVIMPNHTHLIMQFTANDPLSDVIRDFKKVVADRLVRQLRAEKNEKALEWLAAQVERPDKQNHKVWEDGYNAKDIVSTEFLHQKMDYIHNNPCQPHWNLSAAPADYTWSSARFYLTDEPCIIPIDDARLLLS
jgi:putative transposase